MRKILKSFSFVVVFAICAFSVGFVTNSHIIKIIKGSFFSTYPSEYINPWDFNWFVDTLDLDMAWDLVTNYSGPVGIIDSGVSTSHIDLSSNYNSALSQDCLYLNRDPYVDELSHGSKVAGIFGAAANNGNDTYGVVWNSNIVSLRIDTDDIYHVETADGLINAIQYAIDNNIKLLNFSGGFVLPSAIGTEGESINSNQLSTLYSKLANYDGLLVCASGISGVELDNLIHAIYPQVLNLDNIIVVGGSTSSDSRCDFSNTSSTYVDLFAPGSSLKSTNNNNGTTYWLQGTSFSAPFVTGTLALMKSINPDLSSSQLKTILLNSVDVSTSFVEKCVSGGRLNVYKSIINSIPSFNASNPYIGSLSIAANSSRWIKLIVATPGTYAITNISSLTLSSSLYLENNYLTSVASGTCGTGGTLFSYNFSSAGTYYLKTTNVTQYNGFISLIIN